MSIIYSGPQFVSICWPVEVENMFLPPKIHHWDKYKIIQIFWFFFFFLFFLFRATPVAYAYESSRLGVTSELQQSAYTTATAMPDPICICNLYHNFYSSTGSLTHWVRPAIKPSSSWTLVRFLTHWATMGTPDISLLFFFFFFPTLQEGGQVILLYFYF